MFEDWLTLDRGTLKIPRTKTINRSLTRSELELQRQINLRLGLNAIMSDIFVNELPNIKAEHAVMPRGCAEQLWNNAAPDIKEINSRLPASEKLFWKDRKDIEQPSIYTFNDEQLALIARVIGKMHEDRKNLKGQIAQVVALNAKLKDQNAQFEAQNVELKNARRDPIPYLWTAYRRKLGSKIRKWRSRFSRPWL